MTASFSSGLTLPGGIEVGESLRRDFSFKPLNGELEMLLSGQESSARSFPERLSEILCAALHSVGGQAVNGEGVRQLSVGDRQFLIKELAALVCPGLQWVSADCGECGQPMDASFRYAELPVKAAGPEYPRFTYRLGDRELSLRVPNGADQEEIASAGDEQEALRLLLSRIVETETVLKEKPLDTYLSQDTIVALEAAIEAASPEVGNCLLVSCPECGTDNTIDLDIYSFLSGLGSELLVEVHQMASHYHWPEHDILRLPRERRKRYLALIDRARGMTGGEA